MYRIPLPFSGLTGTVRSGFLFQTTQEQINAKDSIDDNLEYFEKLLTLIMEGLTATRPLR